MTQKELEEKSWAEFNDEFRCHSPFEFRRGHRAGYQDAQIEVKDTAIAFAEWILANAYEVSGKQGKGWVYASNGSSWLNSKELYDLFLASQNKQQ